MGKQRRRLLGRIDAATSEAERRALRKELDQLDGIKEKPAPEKIPAKRNKKPAEKKAWSKKK